MQRLWKLFKPRPDAAADPATAEAAAPAPVEPALVEAELIALDEQLSEAAQQAEQVVLEVDDLELSPRVLESLRIAFREGAHALLYDPEEYTCIVSTLGNGIIHQVAECSLEGYASSRDVLLSLDQRTLRHEGNVQMVQIFHALTDLGKRIIVQFFPMDWDPEIIAERRKGNVRLINRLRPGTSLSSHNRETLLRALKRAPPREGPGFLERLDKEGLCPASVMADEQATPEQKLERVLRREALPRKALARILGEHLGLPFVDVEETVPRRDTARLFTQRQVLDWEAIPCEDTGDAIVVAMADPTDIATQQRIESLLGRPCVWKCAAATDIRLAADKIFRTD